MSRGAARALAIVLALAAAGCGRKPLPQAEAIFTNARLLPPGGATTASTGDAGAAAGRTVSIAVAGGRILAVGDAATVDRHRGDRTAGADLGGDVVAPGFEDALARPLESGERLLNDASGGTVFLDLSAAESEEDAVQRVRQRARALGPGVWILGSGWDERRWIVARPPDARLLSDIVQSNPAFLVRSDGGSAWVNLKALETAGLGKAAVPVAGAECAAILRRSPPLSVEERRAAIEASLQRSVTAGVTAVQAVASTGRLGLEDRQAPATTVLEPWRDLARRNRLPVRVSLLVPAPSAAAEAIVASGPESFPGAGRLEIRTLLLDAGAGASAAGVNAAGPGGASSEGAVWARRGAAAGFDILVTAHGDGIETGRGWLAEARRARAETRGCLAIDAKADLTDAALAALAADGIEVVVVAAADDAGAAGALAERLRAAHLVVLAGTGADGAPPAALRRFAAGPWESALAAGGPADFLVLPAASGALPADPASAPALEPLAVRVGGSETYRRGPGARPPG